jgi:uncharacterized membrane protein required for colicin V production
MKKNMGSTDKIIRIIVAIFVAVLYFTGIINGTLALILGAFAAIMLLTSFVSFCPLYLPFGISTRKKE